MCFTKLYVRTQARTHSHTHTPTPSSSVSQLLKFPDEDKELGRSPLNLTSLLFKHRFYNHGSLLFDFPLHYKCRLNIHLKNRKKKRNHTVIIFLNYSHIKKKKKKHLVRTNSASNTDSELNVCLHFAWRRKATGSSKGSHDTCTVFHKTHHCCTHGVCTLISEWIFLLIIVSAQKWSLSFFTCCAVKLHYCSDRWLSLMPKSACGNLIMTCMVSFMNTVSVRPR